MGPEIGSRYCILSINITTEFAFLKPLIFPIYYYHTEPINHFDIVFISQKINSNPCPQINVKICPDHHQRKVQNRLLSKSLNFFNLMAFMASIRGYSQRSCVLASIHTTSSDVSFKFLPDKII